MHRGSLLRVRPPTWRTDGLQWQSMFGRVDVASGQHRWGIVSVWRCAAAACSSTLLPTGASNKRGCKETRAMGGRWKRSMSDHPDSNQGQSDFCADYSQMLDQLSYSRLATRCNVDEITIRTVKTTETQKRTQFVNASFAVRPHSQRNAYPALSSSRSDWQR